MLVELAELPSAAAAALSVRVMATRSTSAEPAQQTVRLRPGGGGRGLVGGGKERGGSGVQATITEQLRKRHLLLTTLPLATCLLPEGAFPICAARIL